MGLELPSSSPLHPPDTLRQEENYQRLLTALCTPSYTAIFLLNNGPEDNG